MANVLWAAMLWAATEGTHPAASAVDRWHEALRGERKEAVLEMMAADAIVFESGEAEMSREEYAGKHLGADMEFSRSTTMTVASRRVVDLGNAALVLSHTATSGTFRGKTVASRGVETIVLEKTGDAWRIRHIHWSAQGQPSAAAELTARSLASQLRVAKLEVKERPPVDQPFFRVPAKILLVGEDELEVFEFATPKEAEEAAATVSPNGGTIGTSSMHWIAPPHFHRKGRLVVIHLGSRAELVAALERLLGAPFAGLP